MALPVVDYGDEEKITVIYPGDRTSLCLVLNLSVRICL